jgi:hypothetical protein
MSATTPERPFHADWANMPRQSHMSGSDKFGQATLFATIRARKAQTTGRSSWLIQARLARTRAAARKSSVPTNPTLLSSIGRNVEGRLEPSPAPKPQLSASLPKENWSAPVLVSKDGLPVFSVSVVRSIGIKVGAASRRPAKTPIPASAPPVGTLPPQAKKACSPAPIAMTMKATPAARAVAEVEHHMFAAAIQMRT